MQLVISLAWRNVWRHRRRSLVTGGAVGVVVFLSVVYFSFGGAAENSLYQRLTEAAGHVQVLQDGWRDAGTFEQTLITDADAVRSTAEDLAATHFEAPLVVGVLEVPVLLSGIERSRGLALRGQDWPELAQQRSLVGGTLDGRFVSGPGELVLGASLARALDVGIGDDVYAYTPTGRGFGAAIFTLVGTVDLADGTTEGSTAWTLLEDRQILAAPGAVQRFDVHGTTLLHIADDEVSEDLASALGNALPNLEASTWLTLNPGTARLLETLDPLLFAVSIMFFILAGLLVLNTVYLSVMERIKEFGVIHALGAGDRRVLSMIATESVLMCTTGAVLGTVAGLAVVTIYADGLVIPGLVEYYAAFGMNPVFYLSIEPQQLLFAVAFTFVTAVAAALWPAWIASRLEPVEAMRFQA